MSTTILDDNIGGLVMDYLNMEKHFKDSGFTIELDELNQLENGGKDETTYTLYLYADTNEDYIAVISINSLDNPKDIQFAYDYFNGKVKN